MFEQYLIEQGFSEEAYTPMYVEYYRMKDDTTVTLRDFETLTIFRGNVRLFNGKPGEMKFLEVIKKHINE